MEEILQIFGITGMALTAFVFIARYIVGHIFSRDLIAHKIKLERDAQQYKHTLDCLLQRFQIQYSRTFEYQADTIRLLYDGIRVISQNIGKVEDTINIPKLFGAAPDSEDFELALDGIRSARGKVLNLLDENDIYLPSSLSVRIRAYLDNTDIPINIKAPWDDCERCPEDIAEWEGLWSERQLKTEELASKLKAEFRRLQGIDILEEQIYESMTED